MARRVFFSFHYKRDSHRVAQIHECNTISDHFEKTPFLKGSEWESIERQGDKAIQNWIDNQMKGCGVVVVLVGLETANRRWVKYEVAKAHQEDRGIVCINMAGMKNLLSQTDSAGPSPLQTVVDSNGRSLASLGKYKTYSWLGDLGRNNVDKWIEEAAVNAGR
ncbi:TIR domain-containing protein [Hymenobacter psoromatis]|uniref:TIR domain-containing protein n=1 Tax=Hymenobacter psoromatis TaxID=1484116 RepID=UPI001CBFB469|nr:TIR domain-containing protein [Hymenobacter psoromatis]